MSTLTQASDSGSARDKAAEMVGVSPRYVEEAKQIAKDALEILDHVKQGKLSVIGWDSEWDIEGGSAPRALTGHDALWGWDGVKKCSES